MFVEVCLRVCVSQVLTFPAPNTLIIAYQQFGPEVFLCRQLIWFISKLPVRFDQRTRREGKQEKLGEWQKWEDRENESEVGGGDIMRKVWACRKWKREYNHVLWEKDGGMTLEVCPDHSKRKKDDWFACLGDDMPQPKQRAVNSICTEQLKPVVTSRKHPAWLGWP